jgi:hypothetical protein
MWFDGAIPQEQQRPEPSQRKGIEGRTLSKKSVVREASVGVKEVSLPFPRHQVNV